MFIQQHKGAILLLFVFLLSIWAVNNEPEQESELNPIKRVGHNIDHFAVNYSKIRLDKSGQPANKLTADFVEHYGDSDETELKNPLLIVNKEGVPVWHIRSESGLVADDGSKIFMQGKVFIDRVGTEAGSEINIKTSNLHIQPNEHYAETADWAEFVTGLDSLSGVGMELVYKEPLYIELLAKVKGIHRHE